MNCLEFRRLLLAQPRDKTAEQMAHSALCPGCAAAAAEAEAFEARLSNVMRVPVPDGLADKVLLRQKMPPQRSRGLQARLAALLGMGGRPRMAYAAWAAAAVLVMGIAVGLQQFYRTADLEAEGFVTAIAVGVDHPAVAAISFVVDHEPRLIKENRSGDPNVMMAAFARLALKFPDGVSVRYLGKCPAPGGTGEHVVLTTPFGQVTLILVPDYPVGSRVMVVDRRMAALSSPSGKGGYILIARSPAMLKQAERLLGS